jgi:long-chain acyl-CoA synthetase
MVGSTQSVRSLIDWRAAASPHATYFVSPETGRELSFFGLRQRALSLAWILRDQGLAPGDSVAFLAPNSVEAVVLFTGIMAAGYVVTPLNLLLTPERLAYVLDHSDCRLVFAAPELKSVLRQALSLVARPIGVLDMGSVAEAPADARAVWPLPGREADAVCLLMYTSGTTGLPKGVRLTHSNVLTGAALVSKAHRLGRDDRVLAVLPLYHINAQIVTVMAPLFHGGSLVMPDRFSTGRFWAQASAHRCTWLNVVPTMIAFLLNTPPSARDLSALRFCRSASAPLPPEHQIAFEHHSGIPIIETMGLTEAAGPVFSNALAGRKIGSAGRPFGNKARVVDPGSGLPVAPGAVGEIQIRGPNVMQGYHKDPGETARALTPDRWLRTGDLGYCDEDGFFFVTGRLKELIIKGGENIAPREIDEALLRHPALLEAAAVGAPDPIYGQDIEAAVVVRPGMTVSAAELLAFCEQQIGRFKTPRAVRILTELPKGPSGKVQRLRLLGDNHAKRGVQRTETR